MQLDDKMKEVQELEDPTCFINWCHLHALVRGLHEAQPPGQDAPARPPRRILVARERGRSNRPGSNKNQE